MKTNQIRQIDFRVRPENDEEDLLNPFFGPLDHGVNSARFVDASIHHRHKTHAQSLYPLDPSL
jgi:hypothetical protein